LLSALIRDSKTRLIVLHPAFEFFLLEYALEEIRKHKELIVNKSGMTGEDVDLLLELLLDRVTIVPTSAFSAHLSRAEVITEISNR